MERMALDCQERQIKEEMIKEFLDSGEFRKNAVPRVGRGPKLSGGKPEGMDIGSLLYQKGYQREDEKKRRNLREQRKSRSLANRPKSNEITNRIMNSIINNSLENLFKILDSDHDGLISSSRIDISKVSSEILKILAPMLIEMEEAELQLDATEFQVAVRRLMKVFNFFYIF